MLIAYTLPAINRGLQAAGRVIRSESERGVLLFCDRRFSEEGQAGVRSFLPDWVKLELILANASEGREIIEKKVAEWNLKKPLLAKATSFGKKDSNEAEIPRKTRARKSGKKDLRDLARSLGIGAPSSHGSEQKSKHR